MTNILSLDVGGRRIGVARASLVARLPEPLKVLHNTDSVWDELRELAASEEASAIVVGWPRGMHGQVTDQTKTVEAFVKELKQQISLPVFMQDEALTSVQAEKELAAQGRKFEKGMVDALAATYILDDFLKENKDLAG